MGYSVENWEQIHVNSILYNVLFVLLCWTVVLNTLKPCPMMLGNCQTEPTTFTYAICALRNVRCASIRLYNLLCMFEVLYASVDIDIGS